MHPDSRALADETRRHILSLLDEDGDRCTPIADSLTRLDEMLRAQRDDALAADIAGLVADRLEPLLATRIAALVPTQEVQQGTMRAGLLDAASLYRACAPWLARRADGGTLPRLLETRLHSFQETARAVLAQPDMPDLQPLAMAVLRFDVVATLLDEAGTEAARESLSRTGALLARDALRRVNALIQAYLDDPPALQPRVDFAGVSSRFDDLLVIVTRVVEASQDAERDTFLRSIGSELLDEFGNRVVLLVAALMRAAIALRQEGFRAPSYVAVLLQLERIYALCLLLRERELVKIAPQAVVAIRAWGERAIDDEVKRLRDARSMTEDDIHKSRELLRFAQQIGLDHSDAAMRLTADLRASARSV